MAEDPAGLNGDGSPHPDVRLVAGFTAAYVLAALVGALTTGNREFLFYVVTLIVIGAVVILVHRRVSLTTGTLWCLSIWGLLHMAGGLVPVPESWPIHGEHRVLYSLFLIPGGLKFDQLVHMYGFGVCTWVCWQGLRASTGVTRPTFGLVALCVIASVGLGALNEVIEFTATRLFEDTNVGGYVNTGWDLVANLIGATVAGVLIWLGRDRVG